MKRAEFSEDRKYRYTLWRDDLQANRDLFVDAFANGREKLYVQFIGLNPSTADETTDDNTLRKCMKFARRWGYGSMCMTNLFAWRATDPDVMKAQSDPVGPDNDRWLKEIADKAGLIIVAWGNHGDHMQRDLEVLHELLKGYKLHCLKINDDGSPQHPLYISSLQEPIEYVPGETPNAERECAAGLRHFVHDLVEKAHPIEPERDEGVASTHNHKLEIEPPVGSTAMASKSVNHQWRCKCGYRLGDGREKLVSPCPLAT